jgi:hypothetical protein
MNIMVGRGFSRDKSDGAKRHPLGGLLAEP